jgi:G3E family GTPase
LARGCSSSATLPDGSTIAPFTTHPHIYGISAFSLVAEQPLDWLAFHRWLGDLRATYGDRLLRVKGVLNEWPMKKAPSSFTVYSIFSVPRSPCADGRMATAPRGSS